MSETTKSVDASTVVETTDARLLASFDLSAIDNIDELDESVLKKLLNELQGAERDIHAAHASHSSTYKSSGW
jgi:hypothetical protein